MSDEDTRDECVSEIATSHVYTRYARKEERDIMRFAIIPYISIGGKYKDYMCFARIMSFELSLLIPLYGSLK